MHHSQSYRARRRQKNNRHCLGLPFNIFHLPQERIGIVFSRSSTEVVPFFFFFFLSLLLLLLLLFFFFFFFFFFVNVFVFFVFFFLLSSAFFFLFLLSFFFNCSMQFLLLLLYRRLRLLSSFFFQPFFFFFFFFPSFLSLLCNLCPPQVDDEPFPKFTFVKESCEVYNGMINWSILKFEVLNRRQRFQFVCCTRRHDVWKGDLLPCIKMMLS